MTFRIRKKILDLRPKKSALKIIAKNKELRKGAKKVRKLLK